MLVAAHWTPVDFAGAILSTSLHSAKIICHVLDRYRFLDDVLRFLSIKDESVVVRDIQ